jgi:metal-responsive CopG/Arc/MetJ family transcriptional regulator
VENNGMHSIEQLEKQQVGLRLPKYLIDEIDEFTQKFSVNRTDIIMEAIKSYVNEQKSKLFYDSFEDAAKELQKIRSSEKKEELQTLHGLINELEDH